MVLAAATISWIALVTWIVTAAGGFVLLAIWISRGGMSQRDRGRIRPALILSHFALAATGLVIWIIYLANDSDALAWIALAILGVVAVLGFTMFFIWAGQRQRGLTTAPANSPLEGGDAGAPAEQHFPVAVVTIHGLLAATTLVLVLLAAAGVGGS